MPIVGRTPFPQCTFARGPGPNGETAAGRLTWDKLTNFLRTHGAEPDPSIPDQVRRDPPRNLFSATPVRQPSGIGPCCGSYCAHRVGFCNSAARGVEERWARIANFSGDDVRGAIRSGWPQECTE